MTKLYRISAFLLTLLGITYIVYVPFLFSEFTILTHWFLGTGFFFLFGGLTNIVNSRTYVNSLKVLCLAKNLMLLAFSIIALVLFKNPLVYISIAISLFVLITSFLFYKNRI